MQTADVLKPLWAGIIYKQELDLLLQRASFYIRTQRGELYKYYELTFEGIMNFNLKNEKVLPCVQVELSEIYYSKNNDCNFSIILWDESYTIDIICKNWRLNLVEEFDESD